MYDPGELILSSVHLSTSLYELRPMRADDGAALWVAASEDSTHYQYSSVPHSVKEADAYVAKALAMREDGNRYPFVILHQNRIVGSTSFAFYQPWLWPAEHAAIQRTTPNVCEVGYTWLAASTQRSACNTVCKLLLFQHAFEQWQVHRVFLRTDKRNQRSRNAIERVGGKLEGIRRADVPAIDGSVRDSAYYSIIDSEWPEVKNKLLSLLVAYTT